MLLALEITGMEMIGGGKSSLKGSIFSKLVF